MSKYSFNIKKGNYQIEMISTDILFAQRQVDKLFEKLFKVKGKMRVVLPPIEPETNKKQETAAEEPKEEIIDKEPLESAKIAEAIKTLEDLPIQEELFFEEAESEVIISDTKEETADSAEKYLEELITNQDELEISENIEISEDIEFVEDIEEETELPEETIRPKDLVSEEDKEIALILEEKIKKSLPPRETPVIEIEEPEEEIVSYRREPLPIEPEEEETIINLETFQDIVKYKRPKTKLDYLMWAAYFLQNKEDIYKFSLKQINSKVMPFLGALIDHSVLHEAVSKGFIEVLPDYKGTAEVTEYKLTSEGEDYLLS